MKLLAEIICIVLMVLLVAAFPWLLSIGVVISLLAGIGSCVRGRDEPGGDF